MRVELVEHVLNHPHTGIGRFTRELQRGLIAQGVSVRLTENRVVPLARRYTPLAHFPTGISHHEKGAVAHFMQIAGCSQMLWHPTHPAIGTVHDLGIIPLPEDKTMFTPRERRILDLQISGLLHMDAYVAVSQFTADDMVEKLNIPKEHIFTAHLGVDPEHFHPIPEARKQLSARYAFFDESSHQFDILYTGTELPRKNLITLLEALAELKKQGESVRLIKIGISSGERWREEFLQQIKHLDLVDDVIIVGDVSEDDLPLFYNAVDLFVTASLLEGFGLPIIEAMACGIPVVCSNAGSLPEIAGQAAVLVHPRNPHAFAEAIGGILGDVQRREMLRQQGKQHVERFRWEHTAASVMNAYQWVINHRK